MPLRKDIAVALLQSAQKIGEEYHIEVPVGDSGQITEIPPAVGRNLHTGEKTDLPAQLTLEGAPTIIDHLSKNYGISLDPAGADAMSIYFSGADKDDSQPILSRSIDNLLDAARTSAIYTIEDIDAIEAAAGMSWERAQARKPSGKRSDTPPAMG